MITCLVKLNCPFPVESIASFLLFKLHRPINKLDDQAIVNNITVLPASVLNKETDNMSHKITERFKNNKKKLIAIHLSGPHLELFWAYLLLS